MKEAYKLYDLQDVVCGYHNNGKVLSVPSLKIMTDKMYFVLGRSGAGKSTLLESLALMNNTIQGGEIEFIPLDSANNQKYFLKELWKKNSSDELSEIRSGYFSFIFQQTNLMPSFSVWENIIFNPLMKGVNVNDIKGNVENLVARLGLSNEDLSRKVTELSGGQKQRVAFARALIAGFDVLFGDEPTGNLDEKNSFELIAILKEFIKDSKKSKSAVIVTHNTSLALKYADVIIVISKNGEHDPGMIVTENCFHRMNNLEIDHWESTHCRYSESELADVLKQFI